MAQEITLTTDGSQTFSVVLDGATYVFVVSYNYRWGVWTANISSEGVELVNGVALVGGTDIVSQFTFALKNLFMSDLTGQKLDATGDNLGTDVRLYKLTDAEVAANG